MYYTGTENLVVKVMADSYESDPDVYISKNAANKYPTDSTNSNWHCEREGSETCVIHNGEFNVGETLYLGIKCVKECQYKLKLQYANVITLEDEDRTQLRFDAYST
jgi:hypothetical protein